MRWFLLILALFGPGLALSPGKQFNYKYEGRLGIGIPEIRNRFAGTGIRATVILQVQSESTTVVKLQNIEVGEFAGDVGCELRNPMPIKYTPLSGHGRLLEQPFSINLRKSEGDVMVVTKSDQEWITNLRKSIANLFLIQPIRTNLGEMEEENPFATSIHETLPFARVYSTEEPSIFGRCRSEYSMTSKSSSLQEAKTESLLKMMTEDVELEGGKDFDVYYMKRSINFDHCSEHVILQQTGVGNGTAIKYSHAENVLSRASLMDAVLMEVSGKYRIMSGSVQGTFVLNPFGIEQDKLMSISNQTYHLESVTKITSLIHVSPPTKKIRTWYMEISSQYSPSADSPSWVNFYSSTNAKYAPILAESITTGIPLEQHNIKQFTNDLDQLLAGATDLILRVGPVPPPNYISHVSTDEAKIVNNLEASSKLVRGIDLPNLNRLFDKYFVDKSEKGQMKLKLLIDVCAASGANAPTKMILERMRKEQISDERIASIFFTFPNNFVATPIIEDVMNYIKTLSLEKAPYMTSTVWINVASSLKRICLDNEAWQYTNPYAIFGKQGCQFRRVMNNILTFFEEQLTSTEEPWKRQIIVRAIGNLGIHETFSTLAKIIQGQGNSQVKASAIYSLRSGKFPRHLKDYVFSILMPFVSNPQEDTYLRQAAIATILSWHPPASWWQELAMSTWREHSSNVASYIYFLLKDMSQNVDPIFKKEAKISRFVLPLARPFSPSTRHSYAMFWSKFIPGDQFGANFDFGIFKDDLSSSPREIFASIMNSFGGFKVPILSASYYIEPNQFSFENPIRSSENTTPKEWKWQSNVMSSPITSPDDVFEKLKNMMMTPEPTPQAEQFSNAFISLFDNSEVSVPLSLETLAYFFRKERPGFYRSLIKGRDLHMTKFFNPTPIDIFLPSEVGLPFFVKVSTPIISSGEGKASLQVNGTKFSSIKELFIQHKEINLNVTSNYKFATKTLTTLRALVPWSEKLVASGVETMKSVTLPMTWDLGIRNIDNYWNVSLSVIPTHHQSFPVVHAHTVPFIVIRSMWPGPVDFKHLDQVQLISVQGGSSGTIHQSVPIDREQTGVDGALRWEGDVSYPFTWGKMLRQMSHPEELFKLLVSPTVRMWSSTFYVNFNSSATKEFHSSLIYEPSLRANYDNLETEVDSPVSGIGDHSLGLSGSILLNGTENRYFQTDLELYPSSTYQTDDRFYTLVFNSSRSALPGYDSQPSAYCLTMNVTSPRIDSSDAFRQKLLSEIAMNTHGTIQRGKTCSQSQEIARINMTASVTKERRQSLLKDLENSYSSTDPMTSLRTSPVYDNMSLVLNYTEPIPDLLKNASYHAYDQLKMWSFPHIYSDYYAQNPKKKILASGRRYIGDDSWDIEVKLPTETLRADSAKIPSSLEQITPLGGFPQERDFLPVNLESSVPQSQCIISKTQVKAFDGYTLPFATGPCPTSAIVNRNDSNAPVFMVNIDYKTKKFSGMIGSLNSAVTIVFDTMHTFVDGTEVHVSPSAKTIVRTGNGKYFAEMIRTSNYLEIKIPGNFTARLSDQKVWVLPFESMRGKSAGLCGNYTKGHEESLVGPKMCIYKDPKLYGYSWTIYSGVGCTYALFNREHILVQKFQQLCPVYPNGTNIHPTVPPTKPPPIPPLCMVIIYPIRRYDSVICVSHRGLAMCHPKCKTIHYYTSVESYDCWSMDIAPKELIQNYNRGYIFHKITRPAMAKIAFPTRHALICELR